MNIARPKSGRACAAAPPAFAVWRRVASRSVRMGAFADIDVIIINANRRANEIVR